MTCFSIGSRLMCFFSFLCFFSFSLVSLFLLFSFFVFWFSQHRMGEGPQTVIGLAISQLTIIGLFTLKEATSAQITVLTSLPVLTYLFYNRFAARFKAAVSLPRWPWPWPWPWSFMAFAAVSLKEQPTLLRRGRPKTRCD